MKDDLLRDLILDLLEPGIYKTTAQVVEEFRIEHPEQWRNLEREGEMLYGGGCSSMQQPATRISQVLLSLTEQQRLFRRINKLYYWSKQQ
jgi:hypothetical protein